MLKMPLLQLKDMSIHWWTLSPIKLSTHLGLGDKVSTPSAADRGVGEGANDGENPCLPQRKIPYSPSFWKSVKTLSLMMQLYYLMLIDKPTTSLKISPAIKKATDRIKTLC